MCGGTKCMRTLRTCTGNLRIDCVGRGKRTGPKDKAKRAKLFRVKMTFLKRLPQAEARAARLAMTAAVPSGSTKLG